uniref:Secreted metalloprotease n=1 Tax=Bursaphelenchus xylophilus TaxID=6326 RepID=A0A1I7SUZ2_BURXY
MLGMKAILAGLLICLVVDLVRGGQISYDGESEPKIAMKLDELNEVFDANVTSEFALVYGFISNASLGEINLQHTYVFSTKTLFNSPETMAKYKGSILTEKIPSSEASMRRRIESRLPQRCLRPLIANSIVCLASPDRMMVTKQDGKDEQSNFCCEFF